MIYRFHAWLDNHLVSKLALSAVGVALVTWMMADSRCVSDRRFLATFWAFAWVGLISRGWYFAERGIPDA